MLLDTNVLVRHLTGEPANQAQRATALLAREQRLELPALVLAELVYVLESVYDLARREVATLARSVLAHRRVAALEHDVLVRALALYETAGVHFAEACLAALAERGDGEVASFDRDLDRIESIRRIEP